MMSIVIRLFGYATIAIGAIATIATILGVIYGSSDPVSVGGAVLPSILGLPFVVAGFGTIVTGLLLVGFAEIMDSTRSAAEDLQWLRMERVRAREERPRSTP